MWRCLLKIKDYPPRHLPTSSCDAGNHQAGFWNCSLVHCACYFVDKSDEHWSNKRSHSPLINTYQDNITASVWYVCSEFKGGDRLVSLWFFLESPLTASPSHSALSFSAKQSLLCHPKSSWTSGHTMWRDVKPSNLHPQRCDACSILFCSSQLVEPAVYSILSFPRFPQRGLVVLLKSFWSFVLLHNFSCHPKSRVAFIDIGVASDTRSRPRPKPPPEAYEAYDYYRMKQYEMPVDMDSMSPLTREKWFEVKFHASSTG